MSNFEKTFTVFTPTYNRAHTLGRVFESLKAQIFKDFEWLIIDDGSTDSTEELVNSFEGQFFPIRYIKKENEHKFATMLKGIELANGAFFLPLDSDDQCTPEALEEMYQAYLEIPDHEKDNFTGVCGLCVDQYGKLVGDKYPESPFVSNDVENVFRFKIKGEKWGCHKTSILRALSHEQDLASSGYIFEGLMWYQVSLRGFKTKYLNKRWRIYYVEEGHDAITNTTRAYKKDAKGRMVLYKFIMNHLLKYFKYSPIEFSKMTVAYIANSHLLGLGAKTQNLQLNTISAKVLHVIYYPMGWFYYKSKQNE